MQPLRTIPTLVIPAANDLPEVAASERARLRSRERRLRGPAWAESGSSSKVA